MSRRILGVSFQWTYPSLCSFILHLHLKQKRDLLEAEKMQGQTVPTAHVSQHMAPQVRINWLTLKLGEKTCFFSFLLFKMTVSVIILFTFLLSQFHVSTFVCSPYQGKRITCAFCHLAVFYYLVLCGSVTVVVILLRKISQQKLLEQSFTKRLTWEVKRHWILSQWLSHTNNGWEGTATHIPTHQTF